MKSPLVEFAKKETSKWAIAYDHIKQQTSAYENHILLFQAL